jgi:hypothetical protein
MMKLVDIGADAVEIGQSPRMVHRIAPGLAAGAIMGVC